MAEAVDSLKRRRALEMSKKGKSDSIGDKPGATVDNAAGSLWEIDYDEAAKRIAARRQRITNRVKAAKRLTTMLKVQAMFGEALAEGEVEGKHVENQCKRSRKLIDEVLENGNELVANVRLAADHLHVQHRERIEKRNEALQALLKKEDEDTGNEYQHIQATWPRGEKGVVPTELFAQIMEQKSLCNDLLEKKNDLIATIEEEIHESDNEYKNLIDEYHENVAVLAARMEYQIQALEELVTTERQKLEDAFAKERTEELEEADQKWNEKIIELNELSEDQMENRLACLRENEEELDAMIRGDGEAFSDMKHGLEDSIAVLNDQIQMSEAVHQLNEERLDYEIHVLRKREEEIVLVKSEQKRKITTLQDNMNKLRIRISQGHKTIVKEESQLQSLIEDNRKQLQKLEDMRKNSLAQIEEKKRQIVEMAREELFDELRSMAEMDLKIQRLFLPPEQVEMAGLYLEPLLTYAPVEKRGSSRRGSASSGRSLASKIDSEDVLGSPQLGSDTFRQQLCSNPKLKSLLSTLVHEAHFLVEENLNLLVDDIDENERHLFKLDSILATIGMEGEDEVLEVLQKLQVPGSDDDTSPSKVKESILKIIRAHIEQNAQRRQRKVTDPTAPVKKVTMRTGSTEGKSGIFGHDDHPDLGPADTEDWEALQASVKQLQNEFRRRLHQDLKDYVRILQAEKESQTRCDKLKVQVSELTEIAKRLGWNGVHYVHSEPMEQNWFK